MRFATHPRSSSNLHHNGSDEVRQVRWFSAFFLSSASANFASYATSRFTSAAGRLEIIFTRQAAGRNKMYHYLQCLRSLPHFLLFWAISLKWHYLWSISYSLFHPLEFYTSFARSNQWSCLPKKMLISRSRKSSKWFQELNNSLHISLSKKGRLQREKLF